MTEESKMPFMGHLNELRNTAIKSFIIIVISFSIIFPFSNDIVIYFIANLKNTDVVFISPTEALWANIKLSFIFSFIISLPIILFFIWQFISPALSRREKRFISINMVFLILLFLIGIIFFWLLIFPSLINFLLNYKTEGLKASISIEQYIDFVFKFAIAFGIIFEIPLIIAILHRFKLITTSFLSRNRKYAILLAFILSGILTPTPDAFNQVLMAIPIIVLYEIGIIITKIINKINY